MRLIALVAPFALMAQLCQVEEFGGGAGSITVHNQDAVTLEIRVSDSASCFAGTQTEIGANTTRMFDINENGAFLCVGEGGGVAVENGARYEIHGGAVSREQ